MNPGQQKINAWLDKAFRVVKAVHPTVDFGTDTPEAREAVAALEYCLDEHFCVEGSFMDLEGVKLAWRNWYQLCIPF